MPELRHDPLTGELVLLAPGRAARPHTTRTGGRDDRTAATSPGCPFCPGHEHATPPEVDRVGGGAPNGPGWRLRVFPNLYPIVGGPDAQPGATGSHEVVVLSPDHDRDLARLTDDETIEAFALLRARTRVHADDGHAHVQVAVNQGREAGASIAHPHAQVLALDVVPPAVDAALTRFSAAGVDLVVDDHRRADRDGAVVLQHGDAHAWCSPGSAAPFEVRVAALGGGARFGDATDTETADTGLAVRDTLRRIAAVLDHPAYNVVIHDAPTRRAVRYHWWVTVLPRTTVPAGFELGTGLLVETVEPRVAAEQLRDSVVR